MDTKNVEELWYEFFVHKEARGNHFQVRKKFPLDSLLANGRIGVFSEFPKGWDGRIVIRNF